MNGRQQEANNQFNFRYFIIASLYIISQSLSCVDTESVIFLSCNADVDEIVVVGSVHCARITAFNRLQNEARRKKTQRKRSIACEKYISIVIMIMNMVLR